VAVCIIPCNFTMIGLTCSQWATKSQKYRQFARQSAYTACSRDGKDWDQYESNRATCMLPLELVCRSGVVNSSEVLRPAASLMSSASTRAMYVVAVISPPIFNSRASCVNMHPTPFSPTLHTYAFLTPSENSAGERHIGFSTQRTK